MLRRRLWAAIAVPVVVASKAPSKAVTKPSVNGRHYAREMKRNVAVAEFDEADE